MNNNPFTSEEFNTTWLKHFKSSKPSFKFNFITDVEFFKKKYLPFYINVGKNLTKGINYSLIPNNENFRDKTFLIYDVPEYFDINNENNQINQDLGIKKVFQYKGFLMDLTNCNNSEEYIKTQFSKKNKRYIRWSHVRRLEECFNISYKFIFGKISNENYEDIFSHFHRLLNRRFIEKNIDYHHLSKKKWNFYKELILPLVKSKKASFFVIYDDDIPIGINLNYHSDNVLFKAITVFDIDYLKFSIGKLSIIKLLDWCYQNRYKYSDFSKGYFDYKEIWSNTSYNFDYHILYDKKSLKARIIAIVIEKYFQFKLYLRTKKFNQLYRRFIHKINKNKTFNKSIDNYHTQNISEFTRTDDYRLIDIKEKKYPYLAKHVYSFLFSNPEPLSKIFVYKRKNANKFIIKGTNSVLKIDFEN
jgi:Acetyltransferase (GNAT) domain